MTQTTPPFGNLLRQYRRAAGLTQDELAERAGLSVRGISDLERGVKQRPRKATVSLLITALQLTGNERALLEDAARRGPPADSQAWPADPAVTSARLQRAMSQASAPADPNAPQATGGPGNACSGPAAAFNPKCPLQPIKGFYRAGSDHRKDGAAVGY